MPLQLLVVLGVVLLILAFGMYRSNKILKEKEKSEKEFTSRHGTIDMLGKVVYHGGFPPMPKPAHMTIGLTESYVVLLNKQGKSGQIEYNRFNKIDKFTTRPPQNVKYSLMAWGPLAPWLNRPRYKHFIVISYTDVDQDYNNVVFEVNDLEKRNEYFDSLMRYHQTTKTTRTKAANE